MDKLMEKLVNAFGISGHEEGVRKVIREELKDVNCDINEDKMGNLIVKIGRGEEKLMVTAHMDQIGIIATYIEDSGIVRVGGIGNFKPSEMVNNFVNFEGGAIGKIAATKENPGIDELFIDLGLKSREEVLNVIKEGDVARFISHGVTLGKFPTGPNFDNRVGCYILLKLIKEIKDTLKQLYFVFSTQQELGGRGARAAAFAIQPDCCIVVDVEGTGDVPGGEGNLKLGGGPAISIMNRSLIIHHEVREMLEKAAEACEVKLQYGISSDNSDGGQIHKEVGGIKTGLISVPCRYMHSISEMVSIEDIEATIKVLNNIL